MKDLLIHLVTFLSTMGVGISAVSGYLTINKLWKRRHDISVVNSISVVSVVLSAFVYGCLAIKFAVFEGSFIFAFDAGLNSMLMAAIFFIGIGMWLSENRNVSIYRMSIRALNLEKRESLNLLKLMINPHGSERLLAILVKTASIDNELAPQEIQIISEFAKHWNINPPNLVAGTVNERVTFAELRESVIGYIETGPPKEQASNLIDILEILIKADSKTSPEEEAILEELSGIITDYTTDEKVTATPSFEVVVVPQTEHQIEAVTELLGAEATAATRSGSDSTYIAGKFHSEKYALEMTENYKELGLYAAVLPTQ